MDTLYKSVCIFLFISATYSYRLQCPSISQKLSRASAVCTSSFKYTCLYDTNKDYFSEQCNMKPDYVTQGEKYVITGNLRNVDCASERYQPFPLWSNISGVCMYQKMLCKEEGQVIYNNGSLISDRTCRCDFTKGYRFIKQPKQNCYCIPSEEDCSCYISKCADGKMLSPDYECVMKEHTEFSACPSFENTGTVYKEEKEKKINIILLNIKNFRHSRNAGPAVLVLCIVLTSVLLIIGSLMTQERFKHIICLPGENPSMSAENESTMYSHTPVYEESTSTDPLLESTMYSHTPVYEESISTDPLLDNNDKHNKPLVAAIDFGTTYSGYAYCTQEEYKKNPNTPVMHVRTWIVGGFISNKTPTCVLFNSNKEFDSFGYDAMRTFRQEPKDIDYSEWYYFENFKIMLYNIKSRLTKETMLEESLKVENPEKKKKLKAIDVFAAVISYFKKDLLELKRQKGDEIKDEDIHWVITVPAIWDLKAKQFMRDAAQQANISGDNLTLALEPEAASIYCRKVPVSVKEDDDGGKTIAAMEVGSKYVVLDQGGGTTDIAVHEVTGKNTLKEIHQACGGHWGGTMVNNAFYSFLEDLFSKAVINKVKSEDPSDFYDLLDNFENAKICFTYEHLQHNSDNQTLRIPLQWLVRFKDAHQIELSEYVRTGKYKGKVTVKDDKIRIRNEHFKTFFENCSQQIVNAMTDLLRKKELEKVETILIVGGNSKSTVLTHAIYKHFGNKYGIVIPKDPDIAVMKGAVLFGFNPEMITSRVSQYTYGIAMQRHFIPGVDPKSKKKCLINGRVGYVFDKHVEIGQVVSTGEFLPEHDYVPADREYKGVHFEFYASRNKNPKYVTDDGCSCIGVLYFVLTDISERKDMTLKLNVSGTEIVAIITEKSTGKQSNGYFSLLD